jgi:hypothetical protein
VCCIILFDKGFNDTITVRIGVAPKFPHLARLLTATRSLLTNRIANGIPTVCEIILKKNEENIGSWIQVLLIMIEAP